MKLFSHDKDFIDEIKSCIDFILKNNILTFTEQNYIQVLGTAMGIKMAPKFANIFMAEIEKSLFATLNRLRMCYFRFLDDIFMIWTSGQKPLNKFLNLANDFYRSIHFLDTTIHLQNNKVETKIYSKPNDAHLYLLKSCHSPTTKNIPYSLALKVKRICSTKEYFKKHAQILKVH